jgi:hypothetical protein
MVGKPSPAIQAEIDAQAGFTISDGNFRNFLDFGGVRKIYVSEIVIVNINYIIFCFFKNKSI